MNTSIETSLGVLGISVRSEKSFDGECCTMPVTLHLRKEGAFVAQAIGSLTLEERSNGRWAATGSEPNAWLSKEIMPVVNEFDGEEFAAVLSAIEAAAAEVAAN